MFRKTILVLTAMAAAGLGAVSCGTSAGTTDNPVNMSLNTDPATFDPALAKGGDDFTMARLLFDTVVRKDSGNALAGGIASSWKAQDARALHLHHPRAD